MIQLLIYCLQKMRKVTLDQAETLVQLNVSSSHELLDAIKSQFQTILTCTKDIIGKSAEIGLMNQMLSKISLIEIGEISKLVQVISLQEMILSRI